GPKAHRAAEIAIGLALFQFVAAHPLGHQTDDRVLARAELGRAGARQPRQMPRRLDDRHLHAETDAEIRDIALARETRRLDLTLGAALAEAAGDKDCVHAFELLYRLALGLEDLGIDPVELDADIVGDAAMGHRFGERFVAVREVRVLANDRDVDLALGPADAVNDRVPAGQIGLARLKPEMGADFAVKAFGMIGAGNRVDRVDIDRRDDARLAQIAEQRDLLAGAVRDRALAAAQQDIGLDAKPQELFRRMLGRLGLEFAGRGDPRDQGEVHKAHALAAELVAKLADRFEERQAFDVADRAADLAQHEILVGKIGGDEFLD